MGETVPILNGDVINRRNASGKFTSSPNVNMAGNDLPFPDAISRYGKDGF